MKEQDSTTKTVLTYTDAEMEKILHQDDDYHFPEMKIKVELLQGPSMVKDNNGMLSTGSYPTFCIMATTKQKNNTTKGRKSKLQLSQKRRPWKDHGSTISHHHEYAL